MVKKNPWLLFVAIVVFALLVSGIKKINDGMKSPPGCNPPPFPIMGGCLAKFMIANQKITPEIGCIKLDVNNCMFPSITVRNQCGESIYINGEEIASGIENCWVPLQYYYFTQEEVAKGSIPVLVGEDAFMLNLSDSEDKIPLKYDKCLRHTGPKDRERLEINCEEIVKVGNKVFSPEKKTCRTDPGKKELARYENAPEENTPYGFKAEVGSTDFQISYIVTKNLCR